MAAKLAVFNLLVAAQLYAINYELHVTNLVLLSLQLSHSFCIFIYCDVPLGTVT